MKNQELNLHQKKALVLYPEKLESQFNYFINKIFEKEEVAKIGEVVEYAKDKHKGQYRKEHTPYYSHCLFVALNFMDSENVTADDVIVCLLHDVIEDNPDTNIKEIEFLYGKYVAENVLGLSKKRNGQRITDEKYYTEIINNEKLVLYKSYDRLSNIFSLYFAPDWTKREKYIDETEEKILPMADRYNLKVAVKIREILDYVKIHPEITATEDARIKQLRNII